MQMHTVLTGVPVPDFTFVTHVKRIYESWEEDQYPLSTVRIGVEASFIQAIWGFGMATGDPSRLRDTAMVLFDF